jgi:high-affinity iron transporter
MSLSMVQAQKWKSKWEKKLKGATEQYLKKHEEGNKWALILLPFTVVLREGVETIVFMAGVSIHINGRSTHALSDLYIYIFSLQQ